MNTQHHDSLTVGAGAEAKSGRRCPSRAFALLDGLAMAAALAVVALLVYVHLRRPKTNGTVFRAVCVSNLKQASLSLSIWASMNGDRFPTQVSTNQGGTAEWVGRGLAYPHYAVLSNELPALNFVACPADVERPAGTSFSTLQNGDLSYFMSPQADAKQPDGWLLGDRNLASRWAVLSPGLFDVATNTFLEWGSRMHGGSGNIALTDGSVRQLENVQMPTQTVAAVVQHRRTTSNQVLQLLLP